MYYISETHLKVAASIGKDQLVSMGTCFGKFSKKGKFRLHITCLDRLAQYASNKVWVKQNMEMSFLYGNHVVKGGLGRMTENTPQYAGVIVYNMNDVPLGFGLAAHSTDHCRTVDPSAFVVLHQADVGEYLRVEDELS